MRRGRARLRLALFTLFTVLALAGCGKSEAPVPAPVAPSATTAKPAPSAEKPVGFALEDAKPEMHEGALAIALVFTQNLAGSQAFDTLLHVTGPKGEAITGSWALDENGRTLRFPFVEADKNYKVTIDAAL